MRKFIFVKHNGEREAKYFSTIDDAESWGRDNGAEEMIAPLVKDKKYDR